jgi:O-antigen/teichoic acid export membrane protein
VFGATTFLNAAGFVYHMIASRTLGVAEYGTLYALLSVMALAAAPASIVMPVITRFAAEFKALEDWTHLRGLAVGLARAFLLVAIVLIAVAAVAAVPFGASLHTPAWAIPVVAVLLAVMLASTAYRALAQGVQDFGGYSISAVVEGIAKVAATLLFAAVGWRFFGALAGFIIGSVAGGAFMVYRTLGRVLKYPEEPVRYDWRRIAVAGAGSVALTVAISILGNVDVIVVKHAFDAHQAGIYSAASLGGKILLFGFGFIPAVLLPQAADRRARGERTRGVLAACVVVVVGLGVCGVVLLKYFGLTLLHVLVGTRFDAANDLLGWYGAAMTLVALLNLLGAYGIATHRLAFGWSLLAGSILTGVAIAFYHPTLLAVVMVLGAGTAVTTVATGASTVIQGLYADRARAEA